MKKNCSASVLLLLCSIILIAGCVSSNSSEPTSNVYSRASNTPFQFMYQLNGSIHPEILLFHVTNEMPIVSIIDRDCYKTNSTLAELASNSKAICLLSSVTTHGNFSLEGTCVCNVIK